MYKQNKFHQVTGLIGLTPIRTKLHIDIRINVAIDIKNEKAEKYLVIKENTKN